MITSLDVIHAWIAEGTRRSFSVSRGLSGICGQLVDPVAGLHIVEYVTSIEKSPPSFDLLHKKLVAALYP